MKKIKDITLQSLKAFTLIELLVVTTIIILMSTSGIFYFLDFVKEQEIDQKLLIIEDNIELLDKDIKNYNILDYELKFNTSNTGSMAYIKYINNFDTENQTLEITDIISGSGTINTIAGTTGSGIIKIYKKDKLFFSKEINRLIPYKFNFNESQNYKIIGTNSGEILNDIELDYFSEDNLYPERNNDLELININTKKDKTGTGYTNIKIINIGGNKKIGNNENEIFLFFENSGKEKFIKITK